MLPSAVGPLERFHLTRSAARRRGKASLPFDRKRSKASRQGVVTKLNSYISTPGLRFSLTVPSPWLPIWFPISTPSNWKSWKGWKSQLPYEYATVLLKFDDTSLCEKQWLPYEYARCSTTERERYEKRKKRKNMTSLWVRKGTENVMITLFRYFHREVHWK